MGSVVNHFNIPLINYAGQSHDKTVSINHIQLSEEKGESKRRVESSLAYLLPYTAGPNRQKKTREPTVESLVCRCGVGKLGVSEAERSVREGM